MLKPQYGRKAYMGPSPAELTMAKVSSQSDSIKEVARKLNRTVWAIKSARKSLYEKLGVHSIGRAITECRDRGLLH